MTSKLSLDALLEGLRASPSPQPAADDTAAWNARVEAVMKAALAAGSPSGAGADGSLDTLLDPPELEPEPGEPEAGAPSSQPALFRVVVSGDKTMSQDTENAAGAPTSDPGSSPPPATPPERASSDPERASSDPERASNDPERASNDPEAAAAPPSVTASAPPERKRQSLKAMAERASQAGSRASSPGVTSSTRVATIPPGRISVTSTPVPTSTPLPRPSRPVEAKDDDSGIVDLAGVRAAATAEQVAAAEKAKPATVGLLDGEGDGDKAKPAAEKRPAAVRALPAPAEKKGNGPLIGVVIAALGIAAAFAMVKMRSDPLPPPVVEHRAPHAPEAEKAAPAVVEPPAPTQVAAATPPSPDPSAAASAAPTTGASSAPVVPGRLAAAAPNGGPGPGSIAQPGGAGAADPRPASQAAAAPTATPSAKPGDLASAMAQAVGPEAAKGAAPVSTEPASAARNQNIPEQPSQGSVASAVGAVMGGAKGCVAGASDVSKANITFGSAGAVSSVTVSGWAAANGKTGCVQAALKGAKVGPFSRPSFTVGVTIRP